MSRESHSAVESSPRRWAPTAPAAASAVMPAMTADRPPTPRCCHETATKITAATPSSPTPSASSRFWIRRADHSGRGRRAATGAAGAAAPVAAAVAAGVTAGRRRSSASSSVRVRSTSAAWTDTCQSRPATGPVRGSAQRGQTSRAAVSAPAQSGHLVGSASRVSSIIVSAPVRRWRADVGGRGPGPAGRRGRAASSRPSPPALRRSWRCRLPGATPRRPARPGR